MEVTHVPLEDLRVPLVVRYAYHRSGTLALRRATAQFHQTICVVLPPSRERATFQIKILYIYVYRSAILERFCGCVSAWLRNRMRTKTNICSVQNFLRGNTGHTPFAEIFQFRLLVEIGITFSEEVMDYER